MKIKIHRTTDNKKPITIVLDNGHGKETPGKSSPDKRLLEWKWAKWSA